MSHAIAMALAKAPQKKRTREEILALIPPLEYLDGRTKQAFKNETDIQIIMGRADIAGTISHLQKFEGVYADYSDFDFHTQTERLTQGRMIFDALPAEVRKEFGQDPQAFFAHVNLPENLAKPDYGLPHLAKPGKQMLSAKVADADGEAAKAAGSEAVASLKEKTAVLPAETIKEALAPDKEP